MSKAVISFRYLRYLAIHKLWVFYYGWQLGVPWLAALHDLSKFRPDEFIAYREFFYGSGGVRGTKDPAVKEAFNFAWLLHQNRNKHHHQWWVMLLEDGGARCFEMPDRYRREMLADWRGAGRAINGVEDAHGWYRANRDKMILGPETRAWIEAELGYENA